MRQALTYLWLPIAILAIWFIASQEGWTNTLLLPTPGSVITAAAEMIRDGELSRHVAASLSRTLSGFLFSSCLALTLAWLFSRHPLAEKQGHVLLEAVRVVPPLSLVPLLILWLGIGEAPKITIVILASFFPIYLSALSGLRHVDARWDELARSLTLTRWEKLRHISIPAALPALVTGLRLGFGYSWRALVGAELIAASSGLGYLIQDSAEMSRSDRMVVGILSIAVLGIVMDALFALAARRLTHRPAQEH